jgi:hypothetical protein
MAETKDIKDCTCLEMIVQVVYNLLILWEVIVNLEIIELYCIADETLKSFDFKTDPQCKMSSAEIVTFSLLCGLYFSGNFKQARIFSSIMKFFPNILSHSQLVRRIHNLSEEVWMIIFSALQLLFSNKKSRLYMVDSMPIKAYNNYKSSRAKIFQTKNYHGYSASKKEYFFGIKLHLVIDENLNPIEFIKKAGKRRYFRLIPPP